MTQPQLNLDAPPEAPRSTHAASLGAESCDRTATAHSGSKGSRDAATPCQNPGCPHFIVPADASDERCPDCGHAIRDEEVIQHDQREMVVAEATGTGASHKRPAKAPAPPPDPAGPRSIAARIVMLAQQLGILSAAEEKERLL